jgi:arylsulfatase A-like enzyme
VLFVVDDMGWANLGAHNNVSGTHTPHFDAAVTDGILLERHYTFRWCAPTRSSLMTGRMPYHVLEGTNYVSGGMNMLPAKLKQVGYATHQIGKCRVYIRTPSYASVF